MNLADLKIEISLDGCSDGCLDLNWIVYDSDSGKHVQLDKLISRFVVTVLSQCAQRIAMHSDIKELCQTVQFSIDNSNSNGMGASQKKS